MKKFFSILFTIIMVASLTACANTTKPNSAKAAVEEGFAALKNFDKEKIGLYFEGTKTAFNEFDALADADADPEELLKPLFASIEYDIKDVKENGNDALATVHIKQVNVVEVFKTLLQNVMAHALESAFSEDKEDTSKEEDLDPSSIMHQLASMLKSEEISYIEGTVDIPLTKTDGKWVIHMPDEAFNLISGGLQSMAESIPN